MTHIIQKRDLIEMLKPFDDRDKIQIATAETSFKKRIASIRKSLESRIGELVAEGDKTELEVIIEEELESMSVDSDGVIEECRKDSNTGTIEIVCH